MTEQNQLDELVQLVKQLTTKVEKLERDVTSLQKHHVEEVPEDVVLAISAAVSAYLGNRAKVKAVHFRRGPVWTAQGRSDVHHHNVPHPR